MYVAHKQLVDLVLPVLDEECEGWLGRVQWAVERGVGLEFDEQSFRMVAQQAVVCGHVECLKALIEAGLSQEGIDQAARVAVVQKQVECLKVLLSVGLRQAGLDNAVEWATIADSIECLKLLLALGASKWGIDEAIEWTGREKRFECLELLDKARWEERRRIKRSEPCE